MSRTVYHLFCHPSGVERQMYEHEHSADQDSYTFGRRPVMLVFYEAFQGINQAIAFEKQVKGWIRKKKEALMERNRDKLKELSVCDNATSHLNYERTPFGSAQGDTK